MLFKTIPATADDEGSPTIILIVHVDIWIIWSVMFAPYLQDECSLIMSHIGGWRERER